MEKLELDTFFNTNSLGTHEPNSLNEMLVRYEDWLKNGPKVELTKEQEEQLKKDIQKLNNDPVNHPKHYTSHPSRVECIEITEHYNFCIGNAIKYLWRCGLKNDSNSDPKTKQIEDLKKAIWYISREIGNLESNKYERD